MVGYVLWLAAAQAEGPDTTTFRGIDYGTPCSDVPGMVEQDNVGWVRPDDAMKIGDIKVDSLVYACPAGLFAGADFTMGCSEARDLLPVLVHLWGQPQAFSRPLSGEGAGWGCYDPWQPASCTVPYPGVGAYLEFCRGSDSAHLHLVAVKLQRRLQEETQHKKLKKKANEALRDL